MPTTFFDASGRPSASEYDPDSSYGTDMLDLDDETAAGCMFEEIVGSSEPLYRVFGHLTRVAPTNATVLIHGESGTGKELIARAIHKRSHRSQRAFVRVNCAAIPPSLIASELFGYEKGAFTGATQRHLGRFELANGGTIFLDEIGEIPAETQIALLRVLQEREFERVGGSHPIPIDVRVIAATNRDLGAAVDAGIFRLDLFYRLNVFPILVPPLRERPEDILAFVKYFIERYSRNTGRTIRNIKSLKNRNSRWLRCDFAALVVREKKGPSTGCEAEALERPTPCGSFFRGFHWTRYYLTPSICLGPRFPARTG
jgi:transcriptional regulator with GAF, ATPase, and Fis domain